MFKFLKKQQGKFSKHQYKNLSISLPSHWEYEIEAGDLEACYDPKSQSTLRIHILKATSSQQIADQTIESLTGDQPYISTLKGHLLTNPTYVDTTEGDQSLTVVTWRLINHKPLQKLIAVITYTVLSAEKNSAKEKEAVATIENSLQDAELI